MSNISEKGQEALKTLSKYSKDELSGIDLDDGGYITGLEDAEKALDVLAAEFGISADQAQIFLEVLESMGLLLSSNEIDMSQFSTKAQEGIESINKQMEEQGGLTVQTEQGEEQVQISFGMDLSSFDTSQLDERISTLEQVQVQFEPDTAEYQAVEEEIERTKLQKQVSLVLSGAQQTGLSVEQMQQQLSTAEGEASLRQQIEANIGVKIDDEAWETFKAQIESGDVTAPLTVKIDEEQFAQLTADKTEIPVDDSQVTTAKGVVDELNAALDQLTTERTINISAGGATTQPTTPQSGGKVNTQMQLTGADQVTSQAQQAAQSANGTATVTISANDSPFKTVLSSVVANMNRLMGMSASPTITVDAGSALSQLKDVIDRLSTIEANKTKTITITTVRKTTNQGANESADTGGVTHEALGTANNKYSVHATGTAYSLGTAYAKGTDWRLKDDQDALVNELDNESVVRGGRWFEIPGGPHIEKLKKGDIVNYCDFAQ